MVRTGFDTEGVNRDVEHMQHTLIKSGATMLCFTLPEFASVAPLAHLIGPRIRALNDALRDASAATGAILVDFAKYPVAADPRLWCPDRLHANSAGHARVAAALAFSLGLPGTDMGWAEPLPPAPASSLADLIAAEGRWARDYFVPWVWRHMRGISSGDNRGPKRPNLEPMVAPA